ncbi:hypothetical protein [Micrococcus luteus]|uniref:hypothetical protein n=1 Tax=Micrococcus luteus TaxID=1270 RepID=UPI00164255C5|nr:hypothetical protein [Micrococcus luteus]
MALLDAARRAKHSLFVVRKRSHRHWDNLKDPVVAAVVRVRGFSYEPERYVRRAGPTGRQIISTGSTFPLDHLRFPTTLATQESAPIPRRLFLLWPGDNDLTPARERSLGLLREENDDVEVNLVAPDELDRWVVTDHPLHPAYVHLSAVHRSDYLRAYLMHHHGGAYLDLKPYRGRVSTMIEAVRADPHRWGAGSPEGVAHVAHLSGGPLARDVRRHISLLPSQARFAFRPHTPFTAAWLEEVERRLDYFVGLLADHPAQDAYGTNEDYPVAWAALLGSVYAPLTLKFQERILVDEGFTHADLSDYKDYR